MNNGDTKNNFEGELNPEFWREYIEEKERTRQLTDAAFVEDFWKFKALTLIMATPRKVSVAVTVGLGAGARRIRAEKLFVDANHTRAFLCKSLRGLD